MIKIRVFHTKQIWRLHIDIAKNPFYFRLLWLTNWSWWPQRDRFDYMTMKPIIELGDKWS